MMKRSENFGQNAVFYVSVANLHLLPFWLLAFARNKMPTDEQFVKHYYELTQIFDHVDYLAAVLLGLIIGVVLLAAGSALQWWAPRLRSWFDGALAVSGLAMLAMSVWVLAFPPSGNMRISNEWIFPILAAGGGALLLLAVLAVLARRILATLLRYGVLMAAPIGLVLAVNAVVAATKIAPPGSGLLVSDRSLAPLLPRDESKQKARAVVIFFDFWDYPITFERRPDWLELPAIDRIKEESFFATQAFRSSARTRMAFPSMLTGRKVMWAWPAEGDDLDLVFAERYEEQSWRDNPGLFKTVRDAGYNTAVIAPGYHPYCRLFKRFISHCWIDDTTFFYGKRTVLNRMDNVVVEVLRRIPFLNRTLFEPRVRHHAEWGTHLYFAFKEEIKRIATNPNYDFVFVHWFLPHPPYIRDFRTGEWTYFNDPNSESEEDYFGNLQAVDIAVGEIRKAMEQAGLWDRTAVLLTADHGYTIPDWPEYAPDLGVRVPFILKLPAQSRGVVSDKKFTMTSFRPLFEALFRGDITAPDQIERYLSYPVYHH